MVPLAGYLPMWWYWPEAHGYVVSWPSAVIWGGSIGCDVIYPFVLQRVRREETVLPDGSLMSKHSRAVANPAEVGDKKAN